MRVVLPGEPGSPTLYHVRVRSSNLRAGDAASRLTDPNFVNAGLTKGVYQLQIRLREIDEIPGSSINYADLRYATNAIEVVGTRHSPLLGESAEAIGSNTNNNAIAGAQNLGNLLETDKQAMSIAGNLSAFDDVDWYSFTIDYTKIRATELRRYFSTVFDMDYADGTGRPDTSIYVFDSNNRLILGGLSSNLVDDQATGLSGAGGIEDTSRGSAGSLDPFIGTAELPTGQYFLAVTSSEMIPRALQAYINGGNTSGNALLRLQPVNGVQLIAEDHIEPTVGSTAVGPVVPVLFPNTTSLNGQQIGSVGNPKYGLELDLSEVPLFVTTRPQLNGFGTGLTSNSHLFTTDNSTDVFMVNALSGEVSSFAGNVPQTLLDIAFRPNGELQGFDISPQPVGAQVDQDTLMDYLQLSINPQNTAQLTAVDEGGLAIQTSHTSTTITAGAPPTFTFAVQASDDGIYPNAITFATINNSERGFVVGSRGQRFLRQIGDATQLGTTRPFVAYTENILYRIDPTTGAGISGPVGDDPFTGGFVNGAGTAVTEYGFIDTTDPNFGRGLIGRAATLVLADGSTRSVIRDGDQFRILDSVGFTSIFEFDSGPEVRINYDPVSGPQITDGLQFRLDGVTYEFDVSGGVPGVTAGSIAIRLPVESHLKSTRGRHHSRRW